MKNQTLVYFTIIYQLSVSYRIGNPLSFSFTRQENQPCKDHFQMVNVHVGLEASQMYMYASTFLKRCLNIRPNGLVL